MENVVRPQLAKKSPHFMEPQNSLPSSHQPATCPIVRHFNPIHPLQPHFFYQPNSVPYRSQWPRGLRRRSAAARLLRSWVRIPPGGWMFLCCKCCVLSGRGLCDELITRPEESYRLCCVVVCDLETSRMGAPYIYDISSLKVNDLSKMPFAKHEVHSTLIWH